VFARIIISCSVDSVPILRGKLTVYLIEMGAKNNSRRIRNSCVHQSRCFNTCQVVKCRSYERLWSHFKLKLVLMSLRSISLTRKITFTATSGRVTDILLAVLCPVGEMRLSFTNYARACLLCVAPQKYCIPPLKSAVSCTYTRCNNYSTGALKI
jgi:hypothetical protein